MPPAVVRAAAHIAARQVGQLASKTLVTKIDLERRGVLFEQPAQRRFPPPTTLAEFSRCRMAWQISVATRSAATTHQAAGDSHNDKRRGARFRHQLNIVQCQRIRVQVLRSKEINGEKVCIERIEAQAEGLPRSGWRRHRKLARLEHCDPVENPDAERQTNPTTEQPPNHSVYRECSAAPARSSRACSRERPACPWR